MPLETGRGRRRKMCATCSPSRPRRKSDVVVAPEVVEVISTPVGNILEATRRALASAGATDTPMGQAALVLARRIDNDDEPLAAINQAVKQLRETLASVITADMPAVADPNDEFTRKRLARESG